MGRAMRRVHPEIAVFGMAALFTGSAGLASLALPDVVASLLGLRLDRQGSFALRLFGAIFTSACVVETSAWRGSPDVRLVTHRAAFVAEALAGVVCAAGALSAIGNPLPLWTIAIAFLAFALSRVYFLWRA